MLLNHKSKLVLSSVAGAVKYGVNFGHKLGLAPLCSSIRIRIQVWNSLVDKSDHRFQLFHTKIMKTDSKVPYIRATFIENNRKIGVEKNRLD